MNGFGVRYNIRLASASGRRGRRARTERSSPLAGVDVGTPFSTGMGAGASAPLAAAADGAMNRGPLPSSAAVENVGSCPPFSAGGTSAGGIPCGTVSTCAPNG